MPREKVNRYGIVGGDALSETIMKLDSLVEKPSIEAAPSNLAIAGRYILSPEIFTAIEQTGKGKGGEIQLTDSFQILLRRENIYAHRIEGERHDIGNKLDFLKTTVKFALKRKEFSAPFLKFLRETLAEYEGK